MARNSSWEDLDLTKDEVERLGTALKKEDVRKLLMEYAEEISDPENKKQYEKEITELEKERGIDISFINPEPCYVIKSSVNGQKKAFINICKNDKVGTPTSEPMEKSGSRGLTWSLPFTQAPPRDDIDKNGNRCVVFDVVFHPDTYRLAENNSQFKKMLNNTALDGVEDNFGVQLDRKNLKFPKMKYKGSPIPTVIRKKMENAPVVKDEFSIPDSVYPYRVPVEDTEKQTKNVQMNKRSIGNELKNTCSTGTPYTTPKYVMKHRHPIEIQDFTNDRGAKMNSPIPKELVIEVQLPLLNSSAEMVLDVTQKSVSLVSEKPAKYRLDLLLPYMVDEEAGTAKFDQSSRKLVLILEVKHHSDVHLSDVGRDDSGVESDVCVRTPESSSDESDGNVASQNAVVEIKTDETALAGIAGDEAYRTISSNENKFLNPDVNYLLPTFTCNVVDTLVAFTLHVKNVEPESIEHRFLSEDFCGVHVRFSSVGAGFFPIHYAFCLKFTISVSISEGSFSAEVWDNNVILQMQLESCDADVAEYYAGLDSTSMVKYYLPEPAAIARKLENLKASTLISFPFE
jgi:dynein assembly factor 2